MVSRFQNLIGLRLAAAKFIIFDRILTAFCRHCFWRRHSYTSRPSGFMSVSLAGNVRYSKRRRNEEKRSWLTAEIQEELMVCHRPLLKAQHHFDVAYYLT